MNKQKTKGYLKNSLKTFRIGTAPTLILDISGAGDETIEIRPLDFFDYDEDTYGLLYTSRTGAGQGNRVFKLATSAKSGFNHVWTKQGVVLSPTPAAWDDQLGGAALTKNGSTWVLIYDDFSGGQMGVATGTNLLSLTKHASNPVMDNTASVGAFNRYLRHPSANIIGDTLYCHYEGRELTAGTIVKSNLGYATCPLSDLTDWTIHPEILVDASNIEYGRGVNDAVANAKIIFIDGWYYWWFQAYGVQNDAEDYDFGGTSYAYSKDLVNWNIVGTENYHVYMGLFGYNGSSDFYATCQEVTPVYHNGVKSIYMWDLTSTGIGKIELDGDAFVNTFRGFTMADNFNDNSIDVSKWTTGTGSGITISETGGKIEIVCDGVGSESGDPVLLESIASINSDDGNVICCFDMTRSTPTTGDYFSYEISNADRTTGIRIQRATTTNTIDIYVYEGGVLALGRNFAFTGSDKFKIQIGQRNIINIYKGNGTVFSHVTEWTTATFTNIDFTFKIVANNSVGQTLTLDNFAFGEYDSGLTSTFEIQ
jgi:hypothetical protein